MSAMNVHVVGVEKYSIAYVQYLDCWDEFRCKGCAIDCFKCGYDGCE